MKRFFWFVLLITVFSFFGCGGDVEQATMNEAPQTFDDLTPQQQAKISPDLMPLLAEYGRVDVLVQADPQRIFAEAINQDLARELMMDPAVIWKARQDGAVIWKLSAEQAVIWKMSTDQAVIWKLSEELQADGYPIDDTYESVHIMKLSADEKIVAGLASLDRIAYITPDRDVQVSDLSLMNKTIGTDQVAVRQSAIDFAGYTGTGIGVAVLDSGIARTHADFSKVFGNRVVAARNFTNEGNVINVNDGYGHGTHVAGIIAGNGRRSYDLGYDTTFEGVAPEANLIIAKVLKSNGSGLISDVIEALEWVTANRGRYNIRVVNLSLGLPPMDPWQYDPLCQAVENAVQNRLIVVVAAGNYGYYNGQNLYGSIASPGLSPSAITVGASDMRGTAKRQRDALGHNDNVAFFSSRGPTAWNGLAKPDLVAPGVEIIAPYAPGSLLGTIYPDRIVNGCDYGATSCSGTDYFQMSGTSMAAPVVAGTAALLVQANSNLTNNEAKAILMLSAQPLLAESSAATCYDDPLWRDDPNCLALNAIEQGSGLLNVAGAVYLTEATESSSQIPGEPWVTDPDFVSSTIFPLTGEEVIWGQGLAWTGMTVYGSPMLDVYQEAYKPGIIWGAGLAWTGVIIGEDPVFTPIIKLLWSSSFVSPFSLDGTNEVLGGFSYDWEGEPDMSSNADDWFPEE
ncbi:MAG TPA: S8 family peptidase [bacterium]|nr:S8 family peptidase [bacterium]